MNSTDEFVQKHGPIRTNFQKRKSFTTLGSKFTNLPNELQTDISLKVAARQKTGPSLETNVNIHNLLQGQKTESKASTSAAVEWSMQCKYSPLQQDSLENLELQDNTKQNLRAVQQSIRRATKRIKTTSFRVKRKSFTTPGRKFANLPNELQTEISLKVATQRQKQKPKTHVDICFRNILQGFIQLTKEVNRKQTEVEYMREILRLTKRINDLRIKDSPDDQVVELKEKLEQERKVWAEEKDLLLNQVQELQKENLEGRQRSLDLEEKLQLERQERTRLTTQIREYKRDIARLQDKRVSGLAVRVIRTKAAEEGKKWIRGMTVLKKELFVVSKVSSKVEVYDLTKFSFARQWNLAAFVLPVDIGSCDRNNCLYIFHCNDNNQLKEILRVDSNGKLIKNWSTGDDYGESLSVTNESNVILTVSFKNKLNEYSSDGHLIREINLSEAGILNPLHAIKLNNRHYVVSHGYFEDDLHRVCVVDARGKLQKSFGGKCGSDIGQLNHPVYLALFGDEYFMVADQMNTRILLLDSNLNFMREILSKETHRYLIETNGLCSLHRILSDQTCGRVFVADNGNDGRIMIIQFNYRL